MQSNILNLSPIFYECLLEKQTKKKWRNCNGGAWGSVPFQRPCQKLSPLPLIVDNKARNDEQQW